MNLEKICVIMIIYNKMLTDSITFNCLKDISEINIVICDNSVDKKYEMNRYISSEYAITYINMSGNKGLPKAYNKAITEIYHQGFSWVCLFDDDTFVPKDYFDAFIKVKNTTKSDIYLPLVYDEKGLLSPNIMKKYFCHRAKKVDDINMREISGINSGMIISFDIFKNYRYDENYFLDFVDHAFIRDMRNHNKKICVLPQSLKQNFAANSTDLKALKVRFKILKKDLKYFYSKLNFGFCYYTYIILRRKMRLFLNSKDISVFFL